MLAALGLDSGRCVSDVAAVVHSRVANAAWRAMAVGSVDANVQGRSVEKMGGGRVEGPPCASRVASPGNHGAARGTTMCAHANDSRLPAAAPRRAKERAPHQVCEALEGQQGCLVICPRSPPEAGFSERRARPELPGRRASSEPELRDGKRPLRQWRLQAPEQHTSSFESPSAREWVAALHLRRLGLD